MSTQLISRGLSRSYDALCSLTHPQTVRTNQDTGLIKLIAFVTMFIDHAGKMLFPHVPEMRLIGRLAFPLFAYGIAVGAVYTRDPIKYLSRIVLLALISQPLYAIGLDHENSAMYAVSFSAHPLLASYRFYVNSWQTPSILLPLSLGLCIIFCLRERRWALALGFYLLCIRMSGKLDYGLQGVQLMLLFYLLCEHPLAALAATVPFALWWSRGYGYSFLSMTFRSQVFCVPAVAFACLPLKRRIRLPRWLIYGFYPAHLIALIVLCRL